MSFNIEAYLEERYALPISAEDLEKGWSQLEISKIEIEQGFITYKMEGDAVIIHDLYVSPQFRQKRKWSFYLHDLVINKAKSLNKRVAISFSEFGGVNHLAGIKAMHAAGFFPTQKTNSEWIFIKGI